MAVIFDELIAALDRHYEVPELYVEPGLSGLETRLFEALKTIAQKLPQ